MVYPNEVFSKSEKAFLLKPEQGMFAANIILPKQASGIEIFAAEELAKYIGLITDASISIVDESRGHKNFAFYIGKTEKAKFLVPPRKRVYEGSNGFRLKLIPNGLVIVGGDDLSTLYGVYAFLEEYQGCAWILPIDNGEIVPSKEGISIPNDLDVTQVPSIPVRWVGGGDWGLKNRTNASVEVQGQEVGVRNWGSYHTWRQLIPPERYFDDHPEYYALDDGRRQQTERGAFGGNQLCTSDPEVVKLVTARMNDVIAEDPGLTFIAMNPNDGGRFCECDWCRALIPPDRVGDRHGSASGPVHRFNNEVARRFRKFHPDIPIRVGAYSYYLRYPEDPSYTPEDNLRTIFTTHIHYCHNHAITDTSCCSYIAESMVHYYAWARNSPGMHVYAYECLHNWASLPWPMVHVLKKDMPEYHRTGVEQFYTQTAFKNFSYGLNYFVASKLAWDASADVTKLVREYCRKAYGAAGPAMERYHTFIEDSWEVNPHHVAYGTNPMQYSILELFPPEVVDEAEKLLRVAEAVETDVSSRERVRAIRVDFDYLKLVLNYFNTILRPFEDIDIDDASQVAAAAKQSAAEGEPLAKAIHTYLTENFPEEALSDFMLSGLEFLLRTRNNPKLIIDLVERRRQS